MEEAVWHFGRCNIITNQLFYMAKCVTYYTQTNKIDEFVKCFGVALEHLTVEEKLSLRAVLAYWAYL